MRYLLVCSLRAGEFLLLTLSLKQDAPYFIATLMQVIWEQITLQDLLIKSISTEKDAGAIMLARASKTAAI